jgi:copper oxidase (laccase) domain-containing protein
MTPLSPKDLILVIGPCIRPPCYEVDFAAEIRRQAHEAGMTDILDECICTACHPERYYSYRRELGLTGRMLATLTLLPR